MMRDPEPLLELLYRGTDPSAGRQTFTTRHLAEIHREDADDIDLDEDEETRPYPGRPRAPKLARRRRGAGAGELSDEASALVERFAKGLTGRLSSPIQMGGA